MFAPRELEKDDAPPLRREDLFLLAAAVVGGVFGGKSPIAII
jgi:hypothetical protein|tara:strand:- start:815 stop:940 length:126 start_codon:yes stop_codon:yes gene_type:complete